MQDYTNERQISYLATRPLGKNLLDLLWRYFRFLRYDTPSLKRGHSSSYFFTLKKKQIYRLKFCLPPSLVKIDFNYFSLLFNLKEDIKVSVPTQQEQLFLTS